MASFLVVTGPSPSASNSSSTLSGLATFVLIFLFSGTRIPDRYGNRVPGSKNIKKWVFTFYLATALRTRTILLNWSATLWLLSSFAGTFPHYRWWITSVDVGHNDQREKQSRRPRTKTPQDAAKSGSGQAVTMTAIENRTPCLPMNDSHSSDCERRSCQPATG